MADEIYRVGKLPNRGPAKYAFSIKRRDDGGISLLNIQDPLTDQERRALFMRFGAPITVRSGRVTSEAAIETVVDHEPGTKEHFEAAVHQLPAPFILLPSKG